LVLAERFNDFKDDYLSVEYFHEFIINFLQINENGADLAGGGTFVAVARLGLRALGRRQRAVDQFGQRIAVHR